MVFGCCTDHGGPANVDIFNAAFIITTASDRLFKGVKIDYQKVDSCNTIIFHFGLMLCIITQRQQSTVYFRVQGFDPPIHNFGKLGHFGDICDLDTAVAQRLGAAPGGQNFNAACAQHPGQINQAGFISNRKQCAAQRKKISHN